MACASYPDPGPDIDLVAGLGVRWYRFSLSWPRIVPDGGTEVNKQGLDYYERLVDGLLERGVTPMATLYHWDLPQSLEDARRLAGARHGGAVRRLLDGRPRPAR